jgi:thymidylate kinase
MSFSVVIEGLDASGKQTHSKMLAEILGAKRFSFPNYESVTGKAILGHLKKEWTCVDNGLLSDGSGRFAAPSTIHERDQSLNALVFQALQTANRLEILPEIEMARRVGPVVFDRYWQSAAVYGVLDGLSPELALRIQAGALPQADVNILIDISVEESFKRRPERRDRYETDAEYMQKVRNGYLRLWGERSDRGGKYAADADRWIVVDGIGTVEEVQERIRSKIVCGH